MPLVNWLSLKVFVMKNLGAKRTGTKASGTFGPGPDRRGFTLVELMVIILLTGALMAFSIPAFNNYVTSNRLSTSADRMAADLQLTRSLAITNGQVLRFTATTSGYSIIAVSDSTVIRNREFDGEVNLDAEATANFFPWGMADATVFNMSNCAGGRTINLMPTGIVVVEVPES